MVEDNLERRIRTWRMVVRALLVSLAVTVFGEIAARLQGLPLPFSSGLMLTVAVTDGLILCFCVVQIRRLRKRAEARNK